MDYTVHERHGVARSQQLLHRHAGIAQGLDDGRAQAFGAARDQGATTRKLEMEAHGLISSDRIPLKGSALSEMTMLMRLLEKIAVRDFLS